MPPSASGPGTAVCGSERGKNGGYAAGKGIARGKLSDLLRGSGVPIEVAK